MALWHILSCCDLYSPSFLTFTPGLFVIVNVSTTLSLFLSSSSLWFVFCQKNESQPVFCSESLLSSRLSALLFLSLPIPRSLFLLFHLLFRFSLRNTAALGVFYSPSETVPVISVIGSHRIMHVAHCKYRDRKRRHGNKHALSRLFISFGGAAALKATNYFSLEEVTTAQEGTLV